MDEKEIIKEIINIFNGDWESNLNKEGKFSRFSPIYSFTTENIAGYLSKINLINKAVLTVSGSGDHIINSFLYGASEVISFDINILSAFISELKLVALRKFSYEEFMKFFMRQDIKGNAKNTNAFEYKSYKKIRAELSKLSKTFFDNLYLVNDYNGEKIRESTLFNNSYDFNKLKIMSNSYLQSEEMYDKAKEKVKGKSIYWIHSDVMNITSKLMIDKCFDIALLSNISDYAKAMFQGKDNYLSQFSNAIIMPLYKLLKDKGVICGGYIYDAGVKQDYLYRTQIDNPKIRNEVFNLLNVKWSELCFKSVIPDKKDIVILFEK